jgi:hypothetical protein
MNGSIRYGTRIMTTGFLVLVFYAILLFWGRWFCEVTLEARMPTEGRFVHVSPSGLLPAGLEGEPNADRPSVATGHNNDLVLLQALGILNYLNSHEPGGRCSDVFYYQGNDKSWMYFDRASGYLVRQVSVRTGTEGEHASSLVVPRYAGPEGMSDTPRAGLGRFVAPLVAPDDEMPSILYDQHQRRFFMLDWENRTVRAGPPLDGNHQPVEIGSRRGGERVNVTWEAPCRRPPRPAPTDAREPSRFTVPFRVENAGPYLAVIDASGRIDLLDRETLELIEGKGMLPAPRTLCGQGVPKPGQLLDYAVTPVYIGDSHEYAGMVVAGVSRQGMSLTLAVFDPSGKCLGTHSTRAHPYDLREDLFRLLYDAKAGDDPTRLRRYVDGAYVESTQAALSEVPWGPTFAAGKYILETLHPPALTLASFFLADHIGASASHRALFLVPNSFAALQQDRRGNAMIWNLMSALWVMAPALLLAVFLTWRVARDAGPVGLSEKARSLWILGTLAFGLPAYITYRLTRPDIRLVTCPNCGQARRPDMEKCHRCGSAWVVPELTPPAWQVVEPPEPADSEAPARARETITDAQ